MADTSNFTVSTTIAAALVTMRPGAVREMHWHPNADEWQYYVKGKGRMTVFNTGPNALTMDFNPATSVTSNATMDIMCRTSATPICSFSPCSGRPATKKYPYPTGSHIHRQLWSPST
jgi:hypothetical protein